MADSYIKIARKIKDKAFYSKDSEKVHLWIHLLISANWEDKEELLGGKPIICKAGQFTTGRKKLSLDTGINESKIERILDFFEKIEHQIEQQKTSTNRLISIVNWERFQVNEQQIKQLLNNDRTTSEQQVNTSKEYKEIEEVKEYIIKDKSKRFIAPTLEEIKIYCLERKNNIDAERFYNFYESKGWMVGKNKMKNWKSCVITWEKSENNENNTSKNFDGNGRSSYQNNGFGKREQLSDTKRPTTF